MKHTSTTGSYEGYSKPEYDGYEKTSQYVTMQDGVKLAVDIYRPTRNGELHTEKLPIVWTATQYRRAIYEENGEISNLEQVGILTFSPGIHHFVEYGYIVAVLDVRGSGASFGVRGLHVSLREMDDLVDINEWLASQPYCIGKTGMFGMSYLGKTQFLTAMMSAPSLACIVPDVCPIDEPFMITNGIPNVGWLGYLDEGLIDKHILNPAPPVDEDKDGSMLKAAVEDHKKSPSANKERADAYYYDDYLPAWSQRTYIFSNQSRFIKDLQNSKIPVYLMGGWKDFVCMDTWYWYKNLRDTNPIRLSMGPGFHPYMQEIENDEWSWTKEHLRWYDYWLKGIDNGVMSEPPVHFFVNGPDEWRSYWDLPLPGDGHVFDTTFYLDGRKAGAVNSVNDGALTRRSPLFKEGVDEYTVDYEVTRFGFIDRNYYTLEGSLDYTAFDEKSLTYTLPPLPADMEIIGFPKVHLEMVCNYKDVDVFAYLEEIDEEGRSFNRSEGKIRASFRKALPCEYDNMGHTWHRRYRQDQEDLVPNELFTLDFEMFPICNVIPAGHSIRLTINCSDKGNWGTPEVSPAPQICIFRNAKHPSYLILPVIRSE